MEQIIIEKVNESYLRVVAEPGIVRELSEILTFDVPNAKFLINQGRRGKKGFTRYSNWDGRIRLLDYRTSEAYLGLHRIIKEYADEAGYEVVYEDGIGEEKPFSVVEAEEFIRELNPAIKGQTAELRDYQQSAFIHAVQRERCILLSATSSGKSLILYLIIRYILPKLKGKLLLCVPTKSLVEQMFKDFEDYSELNGWDVEAHCHRVHSGAVRDTDKPVTITTWQSVYDQDSRWFEQFEAVFQDECLHPNTRITMADGSTKAIVDVRVGDWVQSVNPETGEIEHKQVLRTHFNLSRGSDVYSVIMEDDSEMVVTGNHKVLLKSGCWKRVDQLVENDEIVNIGDEQVYFCDRSTTTS